MSREANQMVQDGVDVIRSLRAVTSKYSKEERAAFMATQKALLEAVERVKVFDLALKEATARVMLADEALDDACRDLAKALASEGFDRFNPFKVFGFLAPSDFTDLDRSTQATGALTLAKRIAAHADTKAGSRKAASLVAIKAQVTLDAEVARSDASLAHTQAIVQRDQTLPNEWQAAVTALRAAIRYGDLKEKTSHYATVFSALIKPTPKKKKKTDEPVN